MELNAGRDQNSLCLNKMITCPGKEVFHSLSVPLGATWAEVSLKTGPYEGSKTFYLEASQFQLGKRTDYCKHRSGLNLSGNSTTYKSFRVLGGKNLQLSLGQYWSSNGEAEVEIEIFYHGLEVLEGNQIHLDGASGITEFQVQFLNACIALSYFYPNSVFLSSTSTAFSIFYEFRRLQPK